MHKAWFLLTWRNGEGALLRQRVMPGTVSGFSGGTNYRFDKTQACHNGESLGCIEISEDEATMTLDRDFTPSTGADIWEALYGSRESTR